MIVRQAVIPAAGRGERLGALGERTPKVALSVGGRPLYAWHADRMAAAGIEELRFVLAPDQRMLRASIELEIERAHPGLVVRFAEQPAPRGIADAVCCCLPDLDERFAVLLGDTFVVGLDLPAAAAHMERDRLDAVLTVREVDDEALIRRECTVRVDDAGRVTAIEEKPARAWNRLKPCGVYLFGPALLEAAQCVPPAPGRGERELTDAIGALVAAGGRVGVARVVRDDVNIGTVDDLRAADRLARGS